MRDAIFALANKGGATKSPIPPSLPPALRWNESLAARLSAADRAVGRLAGEGRRLPDPSLLIRPFVRREAVLSSRIEGTVSTLRELLASEAGATVGGSPDDLREVANYVEALEYGVRRLRKLPLSLRLTRELHGKLLKGVRGGSAQPGEFRTVQNWIGPPGSTIANATFVPPSPDRLAAALGDWEEFLHDETLPPLVHAAIAHAQFEIIHPFLDGNGRVGRLLITLLLVARDVLPSPLLYLSAWFEATRREYYARLRAITDGGEWETWLEYFLNGVANQAEDALGRIARIDRLLSDWRSQFSDSTSRIPDRAIALLARNPFWTVKGMATQLDVAFTTAQRAIDQLERRGIVTLRGDAKRNRVYCAQSLLAILEAPPRTEGLGDRKPHRRG